MKQRPILQIDTVTFIVTQCEVGQSLSFSTGGSSSNLGHSVEYQFDWGDGTSSSWGSSTRSYIYNSTGTKSVKARARCQTHTSVVSGWSSTKSVSISYCSLNVTINPSGSGSVNKSPNKTDFTYNETVQLTAHANSGNQFDHWSGDLSGSSNPQNLTMNGNKSVTAFFIQEAPTADFIGNPTYGLVPLTVQFTDQSTGNITSRSWDFGDGENSNNQHPQHTYQNTGTYTVKLKVTGAGGSDTKIRSDYITVNKCFWADIDCDMDVDIVDIQIVAGRWNTQVGDPNYDPICDVDNEGQGDGDIDIVDIQLVAGWWNKPIPPGSGSSMLAKAYGDVPANVILRVNSPIPSGERNGGFYVDVMIENATDLGAFQFDVVSKNEGLKIEEIELGDFLKNSRNQIISLVHERNTERNRRTFGAYSYGESKGASGGGILARIRFTSSDVSAAPIDLDNIQVTDKAGNLIPINEVINANVAETALSTVPKSLSLSQNYPNPFNPTTQINFNIPDIDGSSVRIGLYIYNLMGQLVRTLVDEEKAPGSYSVQWNGINDKGMKMSSGLYFYSLVAGDFKATRKMILVE